jgi:hypothetical protein
MTVGLRTRVTEVAFDTVQNAALRYYALRGELVAKLVTPAGLANPYPLYAELRATGGGASMSERFGVLLLTSHALASAATRDARLTVDNRVLDEYTPDPTAPFSDHEMILRMDPPDHTRVRRLVGKAFTPKAIAAMRPRVDEIARDIVDEIRARPGGESFDVVVDFAVPLTVRVICDVLGVPSTEWRQFREWGDAATKTLGLVNSRADQRLGREGMEAVVGYLSAHIARKRDTPGDDLLSVMIAAEEEGDRLSDRELLANAVLLLLAGFETIVNLIGNGTVALLESRDQWDKLCADPTLMANAVEELLRYDSPVQFTGRNVGDDTEIAGHVVKKAKQVMILLGAANNDPDVFDDPRRLDITRANAKDHIAFSSGAHYCLGAALARLEGDVAFSVLTSAFPDMRLAGTPKRRPTDLLRGYEHIPVTPA